MPPRRVSFANASAEFVPGNFLGGKGRRCGRLPKAEKKRGVHSYFSDFLSGAAPHSPLIFSFSDGMRLAQESLRG
jgi:hypothetical protein